MTFFFTGDSGVQLM